MTARKTTAKPSVKTVKTPPATNNSATAKADNPATDDDLYTRGFSTEAEAVAALGKRKGTVEAVGTAFRIVKD